MLAGTVFSDYDCICSLKLLNLVPAIKVFCGCISGCSDVPWLLRGCSVVAPWLLSGCSDVPCMVALGDVQMFHGCISGCSDVPMFRDVPWLLSGCSDVPCMVALADVQGCNTRNEASQLSQSVYFVATKGSQEQFPGKRAIP